MRYMLLLYCDPAVRPAPGTPEHAAEHPAWVNYTQALAEAGVLVAGDPLHPVETATTIRSRGGETITTDGPFAETKETLGGYYIIDVPDLDEATAWASKVPLAPYGSVEVRPVVDFVA